MSKVSLIAVRGGVPSGRHVYDGIAVAEGVTPEFKQAPSEEGGDYYCHFPNSDMPLLFIMTRDMGTENWAQDDKPYNYLLVSAAAAPAVPNST